MAGTDVSERNMKNLKNRFDYFALSERKNS